MDSEENENDPFLLYLKELHAIVSQADELEFSTGKWNKRWIKITFKRVKN